MSGSGLLIPRWDMPTELLLTQAMNVCTGATGHAEACYVRYDEDRISLRIAHKYWSVIDLPYGTGRVMILEGSTAPVFII